MSEPRANGAMGPVGQFILFLGGFFALVVAPIWAIVLTVRYPIGDRFDRLTVPEEDCIEVAVCSLDTWLVRCGADDYHFTSDIDVIENVAGTTPVLTWSAAIDACRDEMIEGHP